MRKKVLLTFSLGSFVIAFDFTNCMYTNNYGFGNGQQSYIQQPSAGVNNSGGGCYWQNSMPPPVNSYGFGNYQQSYPQQPSSGVNNSGGGYNQQYSGSFTYSQPPAYNCGNYQQNYTPPSSYSSSPNYAPPPSSYNGGGCNQQYPRSSASYQSQSPNQYWGQSAPFPPATPWGATFTGESSGKKHSWGSPPLTDTPHRTWGDEPTPWKKDADSTQATQDNNGQPPVDSAASASDNNRQPDADNNNSKSNSTQCDDISTKRTQAREKVLEYIRDNEHDICLKYITGDGSWALGVKPSGLSEVDIRVKIGNTESEFSRVRCNTTTRKEGVLDVLELCEKILDFQVTSIDQFRDATWSGQDTHQRAAFIIIEALLRDHEGTLSSYQYEPKVNKALQRMCSLLSPEKYK